MKLAVDKFFRGQLGPCFSKITSGLFLLLGTASVALAQSPADDFARRQADEQRKEQIDQLRNFTPKASGGPRISGQNLIPAGGPCFTVRDVVVEGASKVSSKAILKVTAPYEGKCIELKDIQEVLRDLTNLYLNKGYVAARVYVPEQDIKATKILKLVVHEGRLSDIYMNGKKVSSYDGETMTAFPNMKGRIVNMRDVEQGLDQMNRLASNNAKSEMIPGADDGSTILNISNQPEKRWRWSLSHDNLGQKSTGYARASASLTIDDILKINDLWDFSYQRTDKDYWKGSSIDGNSNSYSGSVSIPYGYWVFMLSGYYYDYHSVVPGLFSPIKTSGDSSELKGAANGVIYRDGASITTLNLSLAYKETNNFLLGNKIEVGSRNYTVGSIGLSHSRQMLKGTWTFDLTYSQGLGIFGAVRKHEPGAGDADPEFSKFALTVSVLTPFKIGEQNFLLNNLLVGQYSPDNLFGAEQMSLGGYSNVRGVRESMLFGNNGFFMRNDLIWRSMPWANQAALVTALGEFRPYVGLDYGQIFAQSKYNFANENLASWTVGAKLAGGRMSLDLGYSDIFSSTVKRTDTGQTFVSVAMSF